MTWSNFALWNAQIALLVAAAALLPAIFRMRMAHARLLFWQVVLAACVALPLLQRWERPVVVVPATAPSRTVMVSAQAKPLPPARVPFDAGNAAAAVLAGGMLLRAAWFGLGLLRLRRYRRRSSDLDPLPSPVDALRRRLGIYPEMRLSAEVSGPVTFGLADPVILFPARFPEMAPELQASAACHELLHVRRRDWLFTAIEETLRILFWFHPAIWWVLGQIQLAREQAVDREVVKLMGDRERYVDALLAFSGARQQLDLAPAPLFLRRRHLTARVAAVIKEADMSRKRLYGTAAACFAALLLAGWLVSGSLRLQAAPQVMNDDQGVTVTGADRIIHRSAVQYPVAARAARIEGTVVIDAQLAPDGTVADASVVSGPMELRSAALQSVLNWHFMRDAGPKVQVAIDFKLPAGPANAPLPPQAAGAVGGVVGGVPGGVVGRARTPMGVFRRFSFDGLSQQAADELAARLDLREGQMVDSEVLKRVQAIVHQFDPHLSMGIVNRVPTSEVLPASPPEPSSGETIIRIFPARDGLGAISGVTAQQAEQNLPPPEPGTMRIRVGGAVQAAKLTYKPEAAYPSLAQQARIQGVVRVMAVIAADGSLKFMSVQNGHPLLVPSAMEALRRYQYATTLLNGKPVEVVTTIDVNFTLPHD